ncbi:MAG: preprotein translocase subunit SecE [Holosporales bacterium]|jgi:preprotein translocase SecE subunit|nr:preprotein translocase subunit SecE [Holosporales bacterium]
MNEKESAASSQNRSLILRSRKFVAEVRKELAQVVCPTRHDAGVTTLIVCILAFIMSLYLLVVDRSILFLVQSIMG